MALPDGWNASTHQLWVAGQRSEAIGGSIQALVSAKAPTVPQFLQPTYYLFVIGDYRLARQLLEAGALHHPTHLELLQNLGVLQNRCGDPCAARATLDRYVELGGTQADAYDGLSAACHRLGDADAARNWGRRSLAAKTEAGIARSAPLELGPPRTDGANVIAFSLWGDRPRYLRGALQNLLRAPLVYPDFTCRFYVDRSVPCDVLDALGRGGAELVIEDGEPSARHRLTRRFLVADDPAIARYLVRDCDSVIGPREAKAVAQWRASGKAFHLMRDWWTHSDPMLAGMWGGRGGVLPPLAPLLAGYRTDVLETANWDQWLLRDRIWPSIRGESLVHDRCFATASEQAFPGPAPTGNFHVGQDEFAVRREAQAKELAHFSAAVPSLKLQPAQHA